MDKKGGLSAYTQELMRVFSNTLVATAKIMGFEVKSEMIAPDPDDKGANGQGMMIEVVSADELVLRTTFRWSDSRWWVNARCYFPLWSEHSSSEISCNLVNLLEDMEKIMDYLITHRPQRVP